MQLGWVRAVAYFPAMRMGAIISAFAHAGVVAWVLMGVPKPFAAAPGDVVNVDIVTPDEAMPEEKKSENPVKPPKPEAEKPLLIPPRPTVVTEKQNSAVPSSQAAAPQQQQQAPAPPQQQAPAQQPQQKQQQRSAAARPAAPPPPPPPPPPPQEAVPSVFDPASIPKLKEITPDPGPATVALGYDGPADSTSETGRPQAASLMMHLKKCLRLPAGIDPARDLRVVMRVFLKPDGALASDPMLVSGPAVSEGPALVRAATDAIKQCQPYALPPEKYQDWKMMDLTLRPRDMTGG